MTKPPLASLLVVRVTPSAGLVATTRAPATAAPLASTTVPLIWPVACAASGSAAASAHTAKKARKRFQLDMLLPMRLRGAEGPLN